MTVTCAPPDATLGIAVRLSGYLNCQARALGENGFQALAGGAVGTALLTGLVTLFVALVGYRLMLGHIPDVRDGVGWMVRLGFVLALVTSWPAFQTLVYRVAVEAPGEIVGAILPAAGLPSRNLGARVQLSYDVLRVGINDEAAAETDTGEPEQAEDDDAFGPRPYLASLLVVTTTGLIGAMRIAIGFLLAVAPFAIMSLLFSATSGLFNGWLRALAGAAFGLVGVFVVTAVALRVVESEIAHLQELDSVGAQQLADPQALPTLLFLFALLGLVVMFAGIRMGSALTLPFPRANVVAQSASSTARIEASPRTVSIASQAEPISATTAARGRADAVAESLSAAVYREQQMQSAGRGGDQGTPGSRLDSPQSGHLSGGEQTRIGVAGRRGFGRETRSAARRDGLSEA